MLLIGCASQQLQLGVDAYNQGQYDIAAKYWNPLAKNGNYVAQYNIGLLWEQGLGSTPKNNAEASQWYLLSAKQGYIPAMLHLSRIQKANGYEEAATSWLNLAARWGNSEAIDKLRNWGKPIPAADLLADQKYRDAKANERASRSLGDAAYQIGRALGGGTGEKDSYSFRNNSSYGSNEDSGCISDFSCGVGYKCVKAPLKSRGVCMKSVDEYGTPQYNMPSTDSVGPNFDLEGQCDFDTDCPVGFRCDRTYKTCIKR